MRTIEARHCNGALGHAATTAVIVLWRSKQFSTADIADLLSIPGADVSRLVTVSRSIAAEVPA